MIWPITNLTFGGMLWAMLSPVVYGIICVKANRASFLPTLIVAFTVGFFASYAAYIIELSLAQGGFEVGQRHAWIGFSTLVAIPEETVKLGALIGLLRNGLTRYRPALIIACFIGSGFAAGENLVYLQRFGDGVITTRFLTATAFHVFNAIIMARLLTTKAVREESLRIAFALFVPVVLHGTYDDLVLHATQDGGRFAFVLGFAVAAGMGTLRAYPAESR